MIADTQRRQAILSWIFIAVVFVLCAVLGVLQYRWIGEVSVAARDRLRATLQSSLERVSREFQIEITTAVRGIAPERPEGEDSAALVRDTSDHYAAWKASDHPPLFRSVALVTRDGDGFQLQRPDDAGRFQPAEWPPEWRAFHEFLETLVTRDGGRGMRGPGPLQGAAFEVPIFSFGPPFGGRDFGGRDFGQRRSIAWLIFDVNTAYLRDTVMPELLQRHLGAGRAEYQFEIVPRGSDTPLVSNIAGTQARLAASADAIVPLLDVSPDMARGGRGRGGRGPGNPEGGRWELRVRHRAGSVEAVVASTRYRNLAVTGGVLLMLLASAAALMRFTRRAQWLAELQMNFVAGVSHELRTPLTVINTAAYNLQSNPGRSPEQVARYGALIRQESGRLKDLVEQVLSFAGSKAGRMIQEIQPMDVEDLIDASLDASKHVIEGSHFTVEKHVDPGLPPIAGDPRALQAAVQNLLNNAVKYGAGETNWIGLSAAEVNGNGSKPLIEIRVADRGPGIPADEQRHIFDPFYRGKRALQDQVHGTGLGLTLVKEIVAAHRGSITVRSQPEKGTEFVVRIPAAPRLTEDELANTAG